MASKKLRLASEQNHIKVALIHPPPYVLNMPPLGMAYLASLLKKLGCPFKIFDLNVDYYYEHPEKRDFIKYRNSYLWCDQRDFERAKPVTEEIIDEWAARILKFKPDIVGISVNDHSFLVSNMLSDKIKKSNPKIKIIYGGAFCSPQSLSLRKTTDSVDAYVIGEGEETLAELLDNFEKTGELLPCRGVMTKKNGEIRDFGLREKPDVNAIPYPDFSELPMDKYLIKTTIPILFSRGCSFHCTFCSDCNMWGSNRMRNPKNIVGEMKRNIKKYGVNDFGCNDLIMNPNLKKFEELCEIIIRKKLQMKFSGQGRARNDMSDELLRKLKNAGFKQFCMGIESGSQKIVDCMKKGINLRETETLLKRMHEIGIKVYTLWMVGYPDENYFDFWKTIFFILRNRRNMSGISSVSTCNLHLESELFIKKDEYGIKIEEGGQWYKGNLNLKERRRREWLFRKILGPIVPFSENK